MNMKKILSFAAAAVLASSVLGGCGSVDTAITPENAPTDIMKKLSAIDSDSSSSDVLNAFETLISVTAQAYDYKIEMHNATETSSPYYTGSGDGALDKMVTSIDARDIRYADDKGVYELLEQDTSGQQMLGVMEANATTTDTVYASYAKGGYNTQDSEGLIEYMEKVPGTVELSEEAVKESAKSMVTYPLYSMVGASLILQPFNAPDYYNFDLTKDGNDYVFSISVKDQEAYNEYLDSYVEENYGYKRTNLDGTGTVIADSYDTQNVDIIMTMDENGVLKKILNNNFNVITVGDSEVQAYTKQTCLLSGAPEGSGAFFEDFFKKIADGTYKEGSTFAIDLSLTGQTVDEKEAEAKN